MFENVQDHWSLLSSYNGIKRGRWMNTPLWISSTREDGRKLFETMGLPNQRQEEWKYTDISPISRYIFAPPAPMEEKLHKIAAQGMSIRESVSSLRLVFVNGFFSASLSQVENLPAGVVIGSLKEAIHRDAPLLQEHLAAYARPDQNSFVALNSAFLEDGAFIYIPSGVRLGKPVHLVYISAFIDKEKPFVHHPRNLVIAEKESAVTVVEDYIGKEGALYFSNPVTEVVAMEGAEVEHYKLQQESGNAFHIAAIHAHQESRSRFTSHSVSFGGRLTRNNIHAYLAGTGAVCVLNGLYIINDGRHIDNHTLIDHGAPGCQSSEVYHGILDDRARGVFNGKIYVHPGAQKTDSRQTVRSLMLSNDAVVNAKPQLEIFADDVACSHGATVGQLDADSLYYLRSRGIDAEEARKMLILAFARKITDGIGLEPLRKEIENYLTKPL